MEYKWALLRTEKGPLRGLAFPLSASNKKNCGGPNNGYSMEAGH